MFFCYIGLNEHGNNDSVYPLLWIEQLMTIQTETKSMPYLQNATKKVFRKMWDSVYISPAPTKKVDSVLKFCVR